jgi:hypothetical protein
MAFLVALLTIALIALVVLVVGAPLRRGRHLGQPARGADLSAAADAAPTRTMFASQMDDLEAARDAKYREIRDTELDYRTGKLSRQDYEAIDADLRAEALDILNRVESSRQPAAESSTQPAGWTDSDPPGARPDADVAQADDA